MKLMTVTTAKALLLVKSAIEYNQEALDEKLVELEKTRLAWIDRKLAGAWFHKENSYWEDRWDFAPDCCLSPKWYALRTTNIFYYEGRLEKLEDLRLRIEHLLAENIREVTLEDNELIRLYVPGKAIENV